MGIDEDSYLVYENMNDFHDWILSLKPKAVKDKGISKQALWNVEEKIGLSSMILTL
ncbi:MAG: hypothetical protein ACP5UO_05495 [Thermoplasmata archaeon]